MSTATAIPCGCELRRVGGEINKCNVHEACACLPLLPVQCPSFNAFHFYFTSSFHDKHCQQQAASNNRGTPVRNETRLSKPTCIATQRFQAG
eukprot:1162123-Pelagomonas_calceolata.AAC.11